MTKGLSVYEKVYTHLYDKNSKTKLSEAEIRVKERCLAIYNKKLSDPLISDKELGGIISEQFGISEIQAYRDISNIERLFGNFRKTNKEYIRHIITEALKQVIKKELEWLEDAEVYISTKNLSLAAKELIRANRLDKDDAIAHDWEKFQPPIPQITDDITVLDLEGTPDERIRELRKRYMDFIKKDSEDAEIVEVI